MVIVCARTLQLPSVNIISELQEPMVLGTIISPDEYMAAIQQLITVGNKIALY